MKHLITAYKEHGVLYVTQFEWGGFIWRPLGYDEAELYKGLFKTVPRAKADLEEDIFKECVVDHPLPEDDFDNWQAGIVTTIAQQILYVSTVNSRQEFLQRLVNTRVAVSEDLFLQIYARIISVFPAYTFEQLSKMPVDNMLEKLALVEIMTGDEIQFPEEQKPNIPNFIDFAGENQRLVDSELAKPEGDWNLDRRRRGNS